ncbi:MAG: phage tail tape measure protein [Prevotella sp.]|jgi:TP901 family phage tail tape measure protein|nr:phage tail tape measure protein [Prevotella sp.]
MAKDLNRSIRIFIDNSDAMKKASDFADRIELVKQRLADLDAQGKKDSAEYKKTEAELTRLTNSYGRYKTKVAETERVLNNLSGATRGELEALQRELKRSLKDMAQGTDQYKAAVQHLITVEKQLNIVKKEQNGTLGKNATLWGRLTGGMSASVLAGNLMTKAVYLIGGALKDAVDKIRSFEKANVVLAGILGENKNNIKDLSSSAIELGKNSQYTASQVTELQTELAKLGFSKQEIKDSQKYILDFATALGAELGEAAVLAGASLRAFDADTTETQRYVSAMTVAANKSALSFEYLSTAMPIVAPVAKAFNFTIEDTLALLGKLSDSGFDASTAATSLRNIFLNLADSNGKLAKALGHPVKNLDDLVKGFQELKAKGIDLATALELTDKRSVAAFQTFLQGADKIKPLRDSLIGVGDQLDKLAKDQMDNLDGSVKSLGSSWETLILSFSNSSGPMKKAVDGLTWIVDKLTEVSEAMGKIQDSSVYKNFIEGKKQNATIEFEIKLRKGVEGQTYNLLEGDAKDDFESVVKYNFRKEEYFLQKEADSLIKQQEQIRKKLDETIKKNEGIGRLIPLYNLGMATEESELEKDLDSITAKADIAKAQLEALNDAYKEILKVEKAASASGGGGGGYTPPAGDKKEKDDSAKKQAEENKKALDDIERRQKAETTALIKEYAERKLTKDEYEKELTKIEAKYLDERFALAGLDAEKRAEIERAYYDFKAKLREKEDADEAKRIADAEKQKQELEKWNEDETKAKVAAAISEIDLQADAEQMALMDKYANRLISEQEYQDKLLAIEQEALAKKLRINGLSESQIQQLRKESLGKQISENEKAQRKAEETAKAYVNIGTDFASRLGDLLTEQMQNSEASTAEFQYNMLMLALDTLRQIVLLATAEAIAKEIGSKGIAGIATGAAAAAAINLAFAAVKGLIKKPKSSTSSDNNSEPKTSYQRVVTQQAEGKYDVIGADDGKLYKNVPYAGTAATGIVKNPTLISEDGGELVVSSPDLKALQKHINYPLIVQAINDVRAGTVPQHAAGKYDSVDEQNFTTPYYDFSELNLTIKELNMLLAYLKANGILAKINIYELSESQELVDDFKNFGKKV